MLFLMSFLEVTKVLCNRSQRGSRGRQQVVTAHNILSDSGALISIPILQVYLVRASIHDFLLQVLANNLNGDSKFRRPFYHVLRLVKIL